METECVLSLGDQRWTLPSGPDDTDTITIGRASNADVRLQADDQISRIHARLTRTADAWTLHDESRNGTGLNGHRITTPTALTNGDRIHIGRSILTFHASTTPAASPSSPTPDEASAVAPGTPAPEYSESFASAAPPLEDSGADAPPADLEAPSAGPLSGRPAPADEPYSPEPTPYAPAEEPPHPGSLQPTGPGAAGAVPGFEIGRGDGGWAAYPSADNPEPVRSPWEISAQIDQSQPNWNESDGWPASAEPRRTTGADRGEADSGTPRGERRGLRLPEQRAEQRTPEDDDAVGTVRLPRMLVVTGGLIVLGLIVNLVVTFLSDGPGSTLRWLVAPVIALVVGMVLALVDAAGPKLHRPGRFDVPVLIAIAVVLVGIGVGGFALTAGTEYVAGYLTGNESGADRLVKPVAKSGTGITMTVENVTYTSHFTRIEVLVANNSKQAFTIPIDGTTFTAADGTALRADTGKSSWPSKIPAGGSEPGTITFKGQLPDSADQAVLTFKSGTITFAVSGILLTH